MPCRVLRQTRTRWLYRRGAADGTYQGPSWTIAIILSAPQKPSIDLRLQVFNWTWFRRRSLFFIPAAMLTGTAFGAWHGSSMGAIAEGVDLSIRSAISCLLVVSLGPILAILARQRGMPANVERRWVVAAIALGLLVGFVSLRLVDSYHVKLMGGHGVMSMARSPQAQTLARLFSAFLDQGPKWVVFFVSGGGDALIGYFGERRRHALAALQNEKDTVDAQLAVLQAQVEPHFLFNTLASVRSLVRSDPALATVTIDALADYLRTTLPKFRAESGALSSTLGEQLEHCKSYLTLMNVRMGGRIKVEVDAPTDIRDLPYPPLVLISLVENAVRHGLEPKAGHGAVRMHARRLGDRLEVAIEDDGAGLSSKQPDGAGVGLSNVRSQLRNRFGTQASLDVAARSGGGVTARIRTPIQR